MQNQQMSFHHLPHAPLEGSDKSSKQHSNALQINVQQQAKFDAEVAKFRCDIHLLLILSIQQFPCLEQVLVYVESQGSSGYVVFAHEKPKEIDKRSGGILCVKELVSTYLKCFSLRIELVANFAFTNCLPTHSAPLHFDIETKTTKASNVWPIEQYEAVQKLAP